MFRETSSNRLTLRLIGVVGYGHVVWQQSGSPVGIFSQAVKLNSHLSWTDSQRLASTLVSCQSTMLVLGF